jgi:hypothetical protein
MSDDTAPERGIECLVGKAQLLIPAELVAGVAEFDVSPPPPLARKWVGGLAEHEGRAVVCVCLVPGSILGGPRRVKGVLIKVEDSEVGWVLEVNAVRGFVKARRLPRRTAPPAGVPSWIGAAADASGHTFGWVDVTSMVRELVGSA